jgi:hypothetical protein
VKVVAGRAHTTGMTRGNGCWLSEKQPEYLLVGRYELKVKGGGVREMLILMYLGSAGMVIANKKKDGSSRDEMVDSDTLNAWLEEYGRN